MCNLQSQSVVTGSALGKRSPVQDRRSSMVALTFAKLSLLRSYSAQRLSRQLPHCSFGNSTRQHRATLFTYPGRSSLQKPSINRAGSEGVPEMANGQKDDSAKNVARDMLQFINSSVTQFHAVGLAHSLCSVKMTVIAQEAKNATYSFIMGN